MHTYDGGGGGGEKGELETDTTLEITIDEWQQLKSYTKLCCCHDSNPTYSCTSLG